MMDNSLPQHTHTAPTPWYRGRAALAPNAPILYWSALLGLVAFAFILRLGPAVALPNIQRPDEIFQNLEPAYRMWTGHGIISWEWRAGIRSPMFPGVLAGLMWVSGLAGFGAAGYLAVIAVVLSATACGAVVVAWLVGWGQARWLGASVCGLLCAMWPDLLYFGPKPLAEVQAGNLLIIATYLAAYQRPTHRRIDPPDTSLLTPDPQHGRVPVRDFRTMARMFVSGILLGLVFCFRYQLAPALLLVTVWACRADIRGRWLPLIVGGLLPLTVMGLTDQLVWGAPFASIFRNYRFNITEHGSADFGVQPVYYFPAKLLLGWGAAAVPLALTFLLGFRRAPLLGLVALVILLTHTAIGHKEISFIFAALPPLLIVAGLGTTELVLRVTQRRSAQVSVGTILAASALCVAVSTTTALSGEFIRHWRSNSSVLHAEATLRDDSSLCGLGLRWPVLWPFSGGDVYIGRPVPFYAFVSPSGVARAAPAINAALGDRNVANGLPGFSIERCWGGEAGSDGLGGNEVCLARAPHGKTCIPDPAFELNANPRLGLPGTDSGGDAP